MQQLQIEAVNCKYLSLLHMKYECIVNIVYGQVYMFVWRVKKTPRKN